MIELVLGGARSGKSRYAETRAAESGLPVVYVATAEAGDAEMRERIARHRLDRPAGWVTVEEPLDLAGTLRTAADDHYILVDCLTLWLSNALFDSRGNLRADHYYRHRDALCETLSSVRRRVVMVSNEVGYGVVAADPATRRFVDEAGFLHQRLAQICDRVTLVAAGLPLVLKSA